MTAPTDRVLACAHGCGDTPHRWRDSAEAGDFWRCSECGDVTPTWELTARTTSSGKALFACTGCGAEGPAPTKRHECAPTETPSLTTEQARSLASRWASDSFMDYDFRERLFAWVRAFVVRFTAGWERVAAPTLAEFLEWYPETRCDIAGGLAEELELEHDGPDEQTLAWALLAAAKAVGWPS